MGKLIAKVAIWMIEGVAGLFVMKVGYDMFNEGVNGASQDIVDEVNERKRRKELNGTSESN